MIPHIVVWLSNDMDVRYYLRHIIWLMIPLLATRFTGGMILQLFPSINLGRIGILIAFVCYYVIGTPIGAISVFTTWFSNHQIVQMLMCLGMTTVAQGFVTISGVTYLIP
eukprot:UN17985